jgi:hypothetical protein
VTQFTEDALKVFDEIGNNRTTIIDHIDHIISKASIQISSSSGVAPRGHERQLMIQLKYINLGVT